MPAKETIQIFTGLCTMPPLTAMVGKAARNGQNANGEDIRHVAQDGLLEALLGSMYVYFVATPENRSSLAESYCSSSISRRVARNVYEWL